MGFKASYDKLPDDQKEKLMGLLGAGILWRGWDSIRGPGRTPCDCHACEAIRAAVQVLTDNGMEPEEYT